MDQEPQQVAVYKTQYTRLTTTRLGSLVAAMYRVLRDVYRPLAVENGRESERA